MAPHTLLLHKVVWQHMQGVVGSLTCSLLQIYWKIFEWNSFENRLRFDRIMTMSLVWAVFWPIV